MGCAHRFWSPLVGVRLREHRAMRGEKADLDEVIGLCDRVLVLADGRVVDEFRRGDGDEARILRAVAAAQGRTLAAARGADR